MNINQNDKHYDRKNPYRTLVCNAIKDHFGCEVDGEMWTLGGKECIEFKQLTDEYGLKFKEYHNVNRDEINDTDGVIAHPKTEFFNIWKKFKNPKVIAYDATEGVIAKNNPTWNMIINIVHHAMILSDEIIFICNFMSGYANKYYDNYKECRASWLRQLKDEFSGKVPWVKKANITLYQGLDSKMDGSTTPMTGFVVYLQGVNDKN